MKKIIVFMLLVVSFTLIGCKKQTPVPQSGVSEPAKDVVSVQKKKILFVDSYHRGYEWSDGVTNGILLTLGATLNDDDTVDNSASKVDLKIFRMDTKRNQQEDSIKEAALKATHIIEWWKPNLVIASDDNAFKYLIMPYYRDANLPVVFCGLNWDASIYGAPYKNTTGMVEVALIVKLIEDLKTYSHGDRLGYLSAETSTERKNLEYYNKMPEFSFSKVYMVKTLKEWQDAFLTLQNEVDILIFENNAGITDWNDEQAGQFALENTKIPVGTTNPWTMQCSLIGFTKLPEEQGAYSAKTALKILAGKLPSDIPVVANEKTKIYLNMKIAKKLGITFPVDYMAQAEFLESQK